MSSKTDFNKKRKNEEKIANDLYHSTSSTGLTSKTSNKGNESEESEEQEEEEQIFSQQILASKRSKSNSNQQISPPFNLNGPNKDMTALQVTRLENKNRTQLWTKMVNLLILLCLLMIL
jgi:hypothetical protein